MVYYGLMNVTSIKWLSRLFAPVYESVYPAIHINSCGIHTSYAAVLKTNPTCFKLRGNLTIVPVI